jgi:hypothetical protein
MMKKQQRINNIKCLIAVITLALVITVPLTRIAKAEHGHDNAPAFNIARLLISESIMGREPAGATKIFSSDLEKVYCFLDARDIARDTFVTFTWFYNDKTVAKVSLPVRKGSRWRTYSSKKLAGLKGDWRVEVSNSDRTVIKDISFMVE